MAQKRKYALLKINDTEYGRDDFSSPTLNMQFDRINATLPYYVFSFRLLKARKKPKRGDTVRFYRGNSDASKKLILTFTLSEPEQESETVFNCTAYSKIELLENKQFIIENENFLDGKFYNHVPVTDVIDDILGDTNISCEFELNQIPNVYGFLQWTSKREALQNVLFATGVTVYESADGTLIFCDIDADSTVYGIPKSSVFQGCTISEQPIINEISANVYTYEPINRENISAVDDYIESPQNTYYRVNKTAFKATALTDFIGEASACDITSSMLITAENFESIVNRVSSAFNRTVQANFTRTDYTANNTPIGKQASVDLGFGVVSGTIGNVDITYGVRNDVADVIIYDAGQPADISLVTLTLVYRVEGDNILGNRTVDTQSIVLPPNTRWEFSVPKTLSESETGGYSALLDMGYDFRGWYETDNEIEEGTIGSTDKTVTVPYEVISYWNYTRPTVEHLATGGGHLHLRKIEDEIYVEYENDNALIDIKPSGTDSGTDRYRVRFIDSFTGEILKEELVSEGESATAPVPPVYEGYNFAGWDRAFDNIVSSIKVYTVYEEVQ